MLPKKSGSSGGMISHFAPGVLTIYGEALRKPAGGITGRRANMPPRCLMEGAVRSGEYAAEQAINAGASRSVVA
jgi:monoamine oxidase